MRRRTLHWHLLSALAFAALPAPAIAQEARATDITDARWTADELDNLLAPVALYPDPILAQVLVAATFPEQVVAAQAHVRAFGGETIDQMPWETSVKAVAHYTPVLNLLADDDDWMTALGQAYAAQPADVMDAVQRLRRMANAQGNLQSTAQQQVVVEREVIRIVPAEPRVIYVPTYDPAIVYHRPIFIAHAHPADWSWGVAFPIGVWLTYDVDWWDHRVYYHGWHDHGPRWVVVSRPWIVVSPVYVAPRYTVVVVNRGVLGRRWDTRNVRRYSVVHRTTTFDRHDRGYRRDVGRGNSGNPGRRVGPREERGAQGARSSKDNGSWRARPTQERPAVTRRETPDVPRAERPRPNVSARGSRERAEAPRSAAPRSATPRAESPRRESTRGESGRGKPDVRGGNSDREGGRPRRGN